ncbi:MAG: hypothetical protein ACYCQK_01415 [Acidiferrobacteraceae bacterium]
MARANGYAAIPWPVGGISTYRSFTGQDAGTCYDAQNVRGYDPTTNQLRGAQRCGTSKYVAGQLNGTNFVQAIDHVSIAKVVGGALGPSGFRSLVGVAVAAGNVGQFTRTGGYTGSTNGTAALSSTSPYVGTAVLFSTVYFADGVNWKYWDAASNTVSAMVATAGSLPTDSGGYAPRLICQWRGRLCWAGLPDDPQNWFMSRQFTPLDYDYSPASVTNQNSQQAVAGNNSEAGQVPDIVNTMIPYSDDILVFGGDSSIWQMTGDPAAGGQIDRISDTVGMAFGVPWCKDAYGTVYFWGSRGGLYAFHPIPGATAAPVRLSSMRVDEALLSVDMSQNIVRMAWDDRFQTVMIFVTPVTNGKATTNWAYDVRNQAFWKDVFTTQTHNVTACHLMDGDSPTDRVVLLGCLDGYIRQIDVNAESDDGTAISSYILLGPIQSNSQKLRLKELRAILGMNSDPATIELYAGSSVEAAYDAAEPHFSHTIGPGRNPAIRSGAVSQGMYIKLSNSALNEAWQFEALYAWFEGVGRAAGRQV